MAQAINTSFDQSVEQDVILEQLDGRPPAIQTTLKNAENVYKSFLYLRKMYSIYPNRETIMNMGTQSSTIFVQTNIPEGSNYVTVNNISENNVVVRINGNEYALLPGQKEVFPIVSPDTSVSPIVSGDTFEIKGTASYMVKNIQEY